MKKAIYAGSFDPITIGHVDIINRALKIFDEVALVVANNQNKKTMFSFEQRYSLAHYLYSATNHRVYLPTLGPKDLVADFASKHEYTALIRGIRNTADFDYETQLEQANKLIAPNIETVFILTSPQYSCVSSSLVRELVVNKSSLVYKLVPKEIHAEVDKWLA